MVHCVSLYLRKTASGERSKWDVGNIMNNEPIQANSITPLPGLAGGWAVREES